LEHPTLENISYWIWKKISPHLPPVSSVTIHRESCFQKCKFVPTVLGGLL
jgi:6-pyruvoyl-tetrahydropterin synthase